MRLSNVCKLFAISLLLTLLASCGGGSSSTECLPTDPSCNDGELIDALGADGPLANAIVNVYGLQDFLDRGTAATSLVPAGTRSGADGLVDDIELQLNSGFGPFMLVLTSDANTIDLTTGVAPIIKTVKTIITTQRFTQTPRPRFYATALTSLAVDRSIARQGAMAANVLSGLNQGQDEAVAYFGFGMDPSIDIFSTPPILDETTTSDAAQENVLAYRTALEAYAEVINQVAMAEGVTPEVVIEAVATDLADGIIGNNVADPISAAIFAEGNLVDADYLTVDTGRLPVGGIETVLDNEIATIPTQVSPTTTPFVPTEPDSDADGVNNFSDPFTQDFCGALDSDGDGLTDEYPPIFAADCVGSALLEDDDDDNDTVLDVNDDFPTNAAAITDTDGDGMPDTFVNCATLPLMPIDVQALCATGLTLLTEDDDDDNDNVPDPADPGNIQQGEDFFPLISVAALDFDEDGDPDFCVPNCFGFIPSIFEDFDDDNDGVGDPADPANPQVGEDAFPLNAAYTTDTDGDKIPDSALDCLTLSPASQVALCQAGEPLLSPDPDDDNDTINDFQVDGVTPLDNCRIVANLGQENIDGDAFGDACDDDIDGDGVLNAADNCPVDANPGQENFDEFLPGGDDLGDVCDDDEDADGAEADPSTGGGDNCTFYPNGPLLVDTVTDPLAIDQTPWVMGFGQDDVDMDFSGIPCDDDSDDDGVNDDIDNCPGIPNGPAGGLNNQLNTDAGPDNIFGTGDDLTNADADGDVCDNDDDGDTVDDGTDNCPLIANLDQLNTDAGPDNIFGTGDDFTNADAMGDACDSDDDGDTVNDFQVDGVTQLDNCRLLPNAGQENNDVGDELAPNLMGDVCDDNDDNDPHLDAVDFCDFTANADNNDSDGDGDASVPGDGADAASGGDVCDNDDDNDGVDDATDDCAFNALGSVDGDTDTFCAAVSPPSPNVCASPGNLDPNTCTDPDDGDINNPVAAGADTDGDGVNDVSDNCPTDDNGPLAGPNDQGDIDGNGDGDVCDNDMDGDGTVNGSDPDQDGDGITDTNDPDTFNQSTNFHWDVLVGGLTTETTPSFGLEAEGVSTVSTVTANNPLSVATGENILTLSVVANSVTSDFNFQSEFEQFDTQLTFDSCTNGVDCTLAGATATPTAATAATATGSPNGITPVTASYDTPSGVLSLGLPTGLEATSATAFDAELLLDSGANGVALRPLGVNFIGTERGRGVSFDLSEAPCLAALQGVNAGITAGLADANALQAQLDIALTTSVANTATALASCTPTGDVVDTAQRLWTFAHKPSAAIDLTASYGLVGIDTGASNAVAGGLLSVDSLLREFSVNGGAGGAITDVRHNQFSVSAGETSGTLAYTTPAPAGGTLTTLATGELTLDEGGSELEGFVSSDGQLLTFVNEADGGAGESDTLGRRYAVRLGAVVLTDPVGTYNLEGLVYDATVDDIDLADGLDTGEGSVAVSTFKGVILSIAEDSGSLRATLTGTRATIAALYDDANNNLPALTNTDALTVEGFISFASALFTPSANGYMDIRFTGALNLELQGFYADSGALLFRLVASPNRELGERDGPADIRLNRVVDGSAIWVDAVTLVPQDPQPTLGATLSGFTLDRGAITTFADEARASGSISTTADGTTVGPDTVHVDNPFVRKGPNFKQGVIFGFPQ